MESTLSELVDIEAILNLSFPKVSSVVLMLRITPYGKEAEA